MFAERLQREGVELSVVSRAQIPVDLATVQIRDGKVTGGSAESSFFLAYFIWFLLYIAILLYGIQVLGAVVEEKSSRIVEVLVSSLKPFQLLAGKVAGVGAVGLLQLGIWLGTGKLLLDRRADVARWLGQGPEASAAVGQMSFPEVPLGTLVLFLTYFLLGYFLFAAMFAAVAAMVNSESEARQAQTPVTMLLVIPTVLMIGILNNPDGSMALTLSLVPFTSPIAMPVRWAASSVPLSEVSASIAILIGTVMAITWVAGRIYRVGDLGIREEARASRAGEMGCWLKPCAKELAASRASPSIDFGHANRSAWGRASHRWPQRHMESGAGRSAIRGPCRNRFHAGFMRSSPPPFKLSATVCVT